MSPRTGYGMLGLLSQVGLNIIFTVGISSWVGHYLDRRLNSGPYLTLAGVVIGIAAAYWTTYNLLEGFFAPKGKGGGGDE